MRSRLAVSLIALVVALLASALVLGQFCDSREASERTQAQHLADLGISRIDSAVERCAGTAGYWTSILAQNGGNASNFSSVSDAIIGADPNQLVGLALARNGVVSQIDQRVQVLSMGLDLTQDDDFAATLDWARRTEGTAITTVERDDSSQFVIFVNPVTVHGEAGDEFWGYSLAMFRFPGAIGAIDLADLSGDGYRYLLERTGGDTSETTVVSASADPSEFKDPVEATSDVLGVTWTLSVEPAGGWVSAATVLSAAGLLLLASLAIAVLAYLAMALVQHRHSLESLTLTDDLTKLGNARAYHRTLRRLEDGGGAYALFFIDLDRFKAVNDNYGHGAGDRLLEVAAGRIQGCVRPQDRSFRIGGDEFVVVMEGELSKDACGNVARRLLESLTQPIDVEGKRLHVGASIGFARAPQDGASPSEVSGAADKAMYDAKEARHHAESTAGEELEAALAGLSDFDLARASGETDNAFLVYRLGGDGQLLYVNAAALDLFGCKTLDEFLALTSGTFAGTMTDEDRTRVHKALVTQLDTYSHNFGYASYRIPLADGSARNVDHYGYLMRSSRYGRLGFVFLEEAGSRGAGADGRQDVGKAVSPGIVAMDGSDRLTGLSNRYFYETDAATFVRDMGEDARPAVALFDIEQFKTYNLRHGTQGGDDLLCGIADALRDAFTDALLCRFAGDQFLVLTDFDGLPARVQGVHDLVSQLYGVELDCGIYKVSRDGSDLDVAHDKAKFACDSVKGTFDRAWRIYDDELEQAVVRRNYLIESLPQALSEGWIEVYYQPVVRSLTGELCSVEALTRWRDPTYGLISPGEFVPALEEAHLIGQLDTYMARRVCEDLGEAVSSGVWVVPVSLNLSRLDFDLMDAPSMVQAVMDNSGVPKRLLHVEVTESALSKSPETVGQGIRRLREAGIEVWMDDFGSGYSSFNLLKDHQFDMLKIDMEFMRTVETSERTREIVTSIVQLAKRLGIHTLAEGVETERQRDFLREVGCERIQGYLYGRPMPLAELRAAVAEGRLVVEHAELASYYDTVGLMGSFDPLAGLGSSGNGLPVAIVEFEGGSARLLSWTGGFRRVTRHLGFASPEAIEGRLGAALSNDGLEELARRARESGAVEEETIEGDGLRLTVHLHYLASAEDRSAYVLGLSDIA